MPNRLTQEAIEIVSQPAGNVRLTQEAIEIVSQPQGNVRLTQEAIEVIIRATPQRVNFIGSKSSIPGPGQQVSFF